MLPGVEFARRRRLGRPGGGGGTESLFSLRRYSSVLYTTGHETHRVNSMERSKLSKDLHGWALGSIAREAKERLDEKLRSQRSMAIKRYHSTGNIKSNIKYINGGCDGKETAIAITGNLQREVYNPSKKGGVRKFISWSKLRWKASEQAAECAVCLDEFKTGDILIHLPCLHRFHSSCVVPWLEIRSQCPFCRATIFCNSSS